MGNLGGMEVLVILIVALIVLGPTKLPEAARQVGRAVNEIRRVSSGFQRELREALEEPAKETRATFEEPLAETRSLLNEPVTDQPRPPTGPSPPTGGPTEGTPTDGTPPPEPPGR